MVGRSIVQLMTAVPTVRPTPRTILQGVYPPACSLAHPAARHSAYCRPGTPSRIRDQPHLGRFLRCPIHGGISTRLVHSPEVAPRRPPSFKFAGGPVLKAPSPPIVTSNNVGASVESGRHQYHPGFVGFSIVHVIFLLYPRRQWSSPCARRKHFNGTFNRVVLASTRSPMYRFFNDPYLQPIGPLKHNGQEGDALVTVSTSV
jgi:hypothetical protein